MACPVSYVMLDRIDEYRALPQSHSGALMPFIDSRPTIARNVEVLNETADLSRTLIVRECLDWIMWASSPEAGPEKEGIVRTIVSVPSGTHPEN